MRVLRAVCGTRVRRRLTVGVALASLSLALLAAGAGAAPPVITVPDNMTVEATSTQGAQVSYTASAVNQGGQPVDLTCAPPADASGTGTLTANASFPIGETVVTCTVSSAGVVEQQASFTVTVRDTTPPVLTLPATVSITSDSNLGTPVEYAADAQDTVDGSVAANCSPASGSTFPVGTTTVACSATDSSGNSASGSFDVIVSSSTEPPQTDTAPPVFTGVSAPLTIEATGPQGAIMSYTTPTATDAHDGPIAAVTCTPASGAVFPIGQISVTCTATDESGNTGQATFSVNVVDTTPPALAVPRRESSRS
jgi:hypothetical protein